MAKKPKPVDATTAPPSVLDGLVKSGQIRLLGAGAAVDDVQVIPTGSIGLDLALGVGGYPEGRIVEIYGPEGSGKTTLCLHAVAQAQALGKRVVYVDAEHALDLRYAAVLGVDLETLALNQPDNGEQALDLVTQVVPECGLVVVDSVAALTPKAELEGTMDDSHVGLHARMMARAMRVLAGKAAQAGCTVIFINQLRSKIGVMFGSPETTTGGAALKYAASVRLDVRRIGQIKVADKVVGGRTRVKVVKNKSAPPHQECEFDLVYGQGVDRAGELVDHGLARGVLELSGAWVNWADGGKVAQGRQNAVNLIRSDDALMAKLTEAVKGAKP